MAKHARVKRQGPRLSTIFTVASTTSAVSLNDLQPLESGILPTTCNLAYDTPISYCTTADFASGSRCSEVCEIGIRIIEHIIEDVCDDVDASRNSVLGFAQRGLLIQHACKGDDVTLSQTTSTTAALITTTIPIVLTTPFPSSSVAIPTSASTTHPVSSSQSTDTATATNSLTVSPSTSSTTPKQPTSQATTLQITTQTESSLSSSSSSTQTATTSTSSGGQDKGESRGGGGSPFDTQVSLSSRNMDSRPLLFLVGAVLLSFFIR